MWLIHKLGPWTTNHHATHFWHWRLYDTAHLVFQSAPLAPTRVAIPVTIRRTTIKFSPTVPTTLPFVGPPVTPIDPTIGYVNLPIAKVNPALATLTVTLYTTIQQQFRQQLRPWQCPLFGTICKSHPTNTLHQRLHNKQNLIIVSNALVQKTAIAALHGSSLTAMSPYGVVKALPPDLKRTSILTTPKPWVSLPP